MPRTGVILIMVVLTLFSGLLGAVLGGLLVARSLEASPGAATAPAASKSQPPSPTEIPPPQIIQVDTTQVQTTITQAVQKVGPAVVTVIVELPGQAAPGGAAPVVSGSGVFISAAGYAVTNNHVVEGLDEVAVILFDGSQRRARVVGSDPFADLAVLKVDGLPPAVAPLGNSDILQPGETVIAIGSPLGDFKNTVTVGVVSATGRSIDTGLGYTIEGLIQTDAAINQGNSGGPLLNLAGEVVGLNTLVVRGHGSSAVAEGLGFAIPANTARAVTEQIIRDGFFARPYLGIRWQPITPDISAVYSLPQQWGAYITGVVPGSPAQIAGLQPGDVITAIDGVAIDAERSYVNVLFLHAPGDIVMLELIRDEQTMAVEVTLGETQPG